MQPTDPAAPRPVALVTGAARGIGLATARWFLAQGHRVALLDRDGDELQRAVAALGRPQAIAIHADVSDPAQVEQAVATLRDAFGRLDALVNNAGVAVFKPLLETGYAEWREVMATNLDGVFLCSQACVPLMLASGGGSIVNIASISGLRASTLRVAYGTSKAAVIQLSRQQAAELGDRGIRVNVVAPGPVETAMAAQVHSPAIRAAYRDAIPLGRYGSLDEIAGTVGFLCSPAAGYINGQVIAVDGGFEATGIGLPALRGEA